jgi:phospholipase/carboxylesterase
MLPRRAGPPPRTTPWAPHIQLDQLAPPAMHAALMARVFALQGVEERPGTVADPRESAIWLRDDLPSGPADAFLGNREIGHFHPWDRSLHIAIPPELAQEAVAAGWAEVHPVAKAEMAPGHLVMLYGPRNDGEVEGLFRLIHAALQRAGGVTSTTHGGVDQNA